MDCVDASLLPPAFSVEASVLNCLCEMFRFYDIRSGQVGNGSRHLQYSIVRSCGEVQAIHGIFQQLRTLFVEDTVLLYQFRAHLCIRVNVWNVSEAFRLYLTSPHHTCSYLAALLPCVFLRQFLKRHGHHFHMKVYSI